MNESDRHLLNLWSTKPSEREKAKNVKAMLNKDAQRFALHFHTVKEEFTPAEKKVILNPDGATVQYWRCKFDLRPEDITPFLHIISRGEESKHFKRWMQ